MAKRMRFLLNMPRELHVALKQRAKRETCSMHKLILLVLQTAVEKNQFLLDLPEQTCAAIEQWAEEELRSTHKQILFILREAVRNKEQHLTPDQDVVE